MKFNQFTGVAGNGTNESPHRALFMQDLLTAAPILTIAEFYEKLGGMTDKRKKNASITSGAQTRELNDNFTKKQGNPENADVKMAIFGGIIQTDKAYERQQPGAQGSEHLRQLREFAQVVGRGFTDMFFNGDSSVNASDFDGIRKFVKASKKVKFDTDNGGIVPFGTTTANIAQQKKFLEALDNLVAMIEGGANWLAMDSMVISRAKTIGLDFIKTTTVQDVYGNIRSLTMYGDVPILSTGYKQNKTEKVLAHNETCGTATNCTSIWAGRFGEGFDLSIATNVGLQVSTNLENNFIETSAEFDAGIGLFNDNALACLEGIIIG